MTLTAAEADALSELLGQAKTLEFLNGIDGGASGLYTEHLTLPSDSRFIDHELGLTKARTKTGVSIVAIIRGEDIVPSPEPTEVILSDDLLVAVGTRKGLDALTEILSDSRA